jgi:hypothetical protein
MNYQQQIVEVELFSVANPEDAATSHFTVEL